MALPLPTPHHHYHMISKNIKGFFEFLVLTIISTESMYPKEILARFEYAHIKITEGTLYPLINRLKKKDLLEASIYIHIFNKIT